MKKKSDGRGKEQKKGMLQSSEPPDNLDRTVTAKKRRGGDGKYAAVFALDKSSIGQLLKKKRDIRKRNPQLAY